MKLALQVWTQDPHCCMEGREDPFVKLTVRDGGGGPYLVLDAQEWALETMQELEALVGAITMMMQALLEDEPSPDIP